MFDRSDQATHGWGFVTAGVALFGITVGVAASVNGPQKWAPWAVAISVVLFLIGIWLLIEPLVRRRNVRVEAAAWGAYGHGFVDVTPVVRNAVRRGRLKIAASNSTLVSQDPVPYVRKLLVIRYAQNGVGMGEIYFVEDDTAILPQPRRGGRGIKPERSSATPPPSPFDEHRPV